MFARGLYKFVRVSVRNCRLSSSEAFSRFCHDSANPQKAAIQTVKVLDSARTGGN